MATPIIAYVDPDASGAGTGADFTNAYTTLAAGHANEVAGTGQCTGADLVTNDEQLTFQCRSSGGSADTGELTVAGWTTDATRYVKVLGDQSTGIWDANKFWMDAVGAVNGITITNSYVEITAIQIDHDASSNGYRGISDSSATYTNHKISKCIIKNTDAESKTSAGIYIYSSDKAFIWNNVIYDFVDAGIWGRGSADEIFAYNNTVYNCTNEGIQEGAQEVIVAKNNAVWGCSPDYSIANWGAGSTNNGTEDSTGPGANEVDLTAGGQAAADLWTTPGSDFTVKDVGSNLYQAGADLDGESFPTGIPVTDDIAGTARHATTPCIGAFEFVPAGGRIMSSLVGAGGLAGMGGMAGQGGGLAA